MGESHSFSSRFVCCFSHAHCLWIGCGPAPWPPIRQSVSQKPERQRLRGAAMFCTKLKDLKLAGECPFSLLAPGQVPQEPAEEVAGSSEPREAVAPICQDVPEKNMQESLPQRKTSRSRVYLHTLAESICKLIFPEVRASLRRS